MGHCFLKSLKSKILRIYVLKKITQFTNADIMVAGEINMQLDTRSEIFRFTFEKFPLQRYPLIQLMKRLVSSMHTQLYFAF